MKRFIQILEIIGLSLLFFYVTLYFSNFHRHISEGQLIKPCESGNTVACEDKMREAIINLRMSANYSTTPKKNYHLKSMANNNRTTYDSNATLSVSENEMVRKLERSRTAIGILIPATTRYIKNPILQNLSLTTICIPSIYKTMQKEYTYRIYVGIDIGDFLETVKHKLEMMYDRVKVVVTNGGILTRVCNDISRAAYQDGMDYLVRVTDDTSFETQNWTSAGVNVLQTYTPPNVGVVGPTFDKGNTKILTIDMVHRTHVDIFDFYYPPYFDNWWADDWITYVYKPARSTKLKSWFVKHRIHFHGTRYRVDQSKKKRLNKILQFDRERLNQYLSDLKR